MAQIIRTIIEPDGRAVPIKTTVTQESLQREFDYWRACKILKSMLAEGLISPDEYRKIDALNRQSFSPLLASLMP